MVYPKLIPKRIFRTADVRTHVWDRPPDRVLMAQGVFSGKPFLGCVKAAHVETCLLLYFVLGGGLSGDDLPKNELDTGKRFQCVEIQFFDKAPEI